MRSLNNTKTKYFVYLEHRKESLISIMLIIFHLDLLVSTLIISKLCSLIIFNTTLEHSFRPL